MLRESPIRRVVLVVLDGLRPDAIPRFGLHNLTALAQRGASTMLGRTVSPSDTACAMASLLTGAAPERHGLMSERFHLPRSSGPLHPLPRTLAAHSLPSSAFLAKLPLLFTGIAHRLASHLGFTETSFRGSYSGEIHAAARQMDATMGSVVAEIGLEDPGTLLIALADHGGGGAVPDHHNSEHPLDRTIPVVLAGGAVRRGDLPPGASLLDVPATVAWALGVPLPESFAGRPLAAALGRPAISVAA